MSGPAFAHSTLAGSPSAAVSGNWGTRALAGSVICGWLLLQPITGSIADIAASIFGLFYLGFLPSHWVRLRDLSDPLLAPHWPGHGGLAITLLAFVLIWAADCGGFLWGSRFGRHRLSEVSPGKTVEVDGEMFKEYYGSASDFNKGEYKHVEGKRILEPIKGKLANTLIEMEQDVQSSISYAGGTKLMDIRKVNYVILGGDNAGEHLLM